MNIFQIPMVLGEDKALNQNHNMETDFLDQQVKDRELRELLRKSRTRNSVTPVHYNGKTYWYLEQLTEEQYKRGEAEATKFLLKCLGIGSFLAIALMYVVASAIMPTP